MTISFQFKDHYSQTRTPLANIDNLICGHWGKKPDKKEWNANYHKITMLGIAVLVRYGGSCVTEENLNRYFDEFPDMYCDWFEAASFKFLVLDFEFSAWR